MQLMLKQAFKEYFVGNALNLVKAARIIRNEIFSSSWFNF